ncbi:MAG: trehalose-phosphatase [Hyphomonas sp.]|nr:trehalose-phosphatase [Hyphomonas sp.]
MTDRFLSKNEIEPELTTRHALFLDFDGTLAPLQDDPDTVSLPAGGADQLRALAHILGGALVLISGRAIQDLSARTPNDLWRAGGHGRDVCRPGESPPPCADDAPSDLRAAVSRVVQQHQGSRIENKGRVIAVHYRQNPSVGPSLAASLSKLSDETEGYAFQHGKMVIELKPRDANKGLALESIMTQAPFEGRLPIMVGDDTTDEDAMEAAQKLGGLGIKVGAGETCARYRFDDTDSVWDWLKGQLNEHA